MEIVKASVSDTPSIYALLEGANFHGLPEYGAAKGVLENAYSLVGKAGGESSFGPVTTGKIP